MPQLPAPVVIDLPEGSRLVAIGMPGTGKSSLCRMIFSAYPGNKIVIDPGDSELTTDDDWITSHQTKLDFSKVHSWRWVPTEAELDQGLAVYDKLYRSLYRQKIPLMVWCDEGSEVSSANRTPTGLRAEIKLGRKIPHTHLMATQRPAEVSTTFWSTASHWAIFHISYAADQETVAKNIGLNRAELVGLLDQLGDHGFIWFEAGVGATPLLVRQGIKLPPAVAAKRGVM